MKISRVSVWSVPVPLTSPYFLTGGKQRFDALDSTLIRVETDEGVEGWGESCPWGHTYLPGHANGVRAGLKTILPFVLGADPRSIEHINRLMDSALPGHPYVKSGVDTACWDILGKVSGLPLWQLFGGNAPTPVEANGSVGFGDPDTMVRKLQKASADGFRTHSVKLGAEDPFDDVERIETVGAALPKGERITWDANQGWTPATAIQVLNTTRTTYWVEQPCHTTAQCAEVARRVPAPIMLDESLDTFDDHLTAWSTQACQGVKVKPNRVGGLTKARRIRDFGIAVGWRMHIEDLGGCGLANMAATHLASSTPSEHRLASWPGDDMIDLDICNGTGVKTTDGYITPHSDPGHGVVVDMNLLPEPTAIYQ